MEQTIENETIEIKPYIKLIKGQRDNYGWEIKMYGDNPEEIVAKIKDTDKRLKEEFGVGNDCWIILGREIPSLASDNQ